MIPDLQDVGAGYEVLPPGRYLTTFEEIGESFVPDSNASREAIWTEFVNATEFYRETIGEIFSVWIGGSFVTSKDTPSDIDVTYLIKSDVFNMAVNNKYGNAAILMMRNRSSFNFDLIDSYIITIPPTHTSCSPQDYMQWRGYWDQFWSKARTNDPNQPSFPKCGYLEVILDGE